MRIGITDSGVGGLSVCAAVESSLRRNRPAEDVELLYLNAALEDDYAYNAMPSKAVKLEAFDRFLDHVSAAFRPDFLYIACNTLSALFGNTRFAAGRRIPVQGIVETGTAQIQAALDAEGAGEVLVFATPTTVDEGIYGDALRAAGMAPGRFAEQACPGLADAISNDGSGGEARALLQDFIPRALSKLAEPPRNLIAYLGCTHYGYQAAAFESGLRRSVARVRVLNPNPGAAETIVSRIPARPGNGSLSVRFLSRYAIPDKPLRSLPQYLGPAAPATVSALLNFERVPDLCGSLENLCSAGS